MSTPHASETMDMQYKHTFQTQTNSRMNEKRLCKAFRIQLEMFANFIYSEWLLTARTQLLAAIG